MRVFGRSFHDRAKHNGQDHHPKNGRNDRVTPDTIRSFRSGPLFAQYIDGKHVSFKKDQYSECNIGEQWFVGSCQTKDSGDNALP